ncbi:hypothetical protein [Streptomyces sp. LUP30]|uniref:hypothetical protein n=1 Tax=Streptomyces sp. LUP30 TaxID=1890285 RepID=UPI000851F8B6|nr:hypothetical protein [Streptomyces sp. LUP30]
MTGPEHYREAERLLKGCKNSHGALVIEDGTAEVLAAAQVHATLAQTAATAVQPSRYGVQRAEWKAWAAAAATPEEDIRS